MIDGLLMRLARQNHRGEFGFSVESMASMDDFRRIVTLSANKYGTSMQKYGASMVAARLRKQAKPARQRVPRRSLGTRGNGRK